MIEDIMQDAISKMAKAKSKYIESVLVQQIEAIEGRVPSNQEIAKYGKVVVDVSDNSETFYWKYAFVMSVILKWKDNKFVMNVKRTNYV